MHRELETLIRSTHELTITTAQKHLTSVIGDLDANLLDELFVLYYKLQNQDMARGYETLLERAQNERSIFHQARDLEMKSQWQIAAQQYYASQLSSSETEMREEAASGYYRCLQAGGNWHAALLIPD